MKDFSTLKIKSPYNIKYIEDVKFDWKPNEHASFYLKGIVEDSAQFNAVNSAGDGDEFTLYEGEEGKTIFKGQTSSVKVTNVNGIYYIELKGISGSFNLDQSKKSRSFQDENMEYGSLISQTIRDYSGSNFMQYVGEGEKIGNPIIQYKETAWEFLKRMASKFNSVLVCDIMENKPRFYFGLPELRDYTIDEDIPYTASKDIKAFEASGAAEAGLRDIDFFAYEIESCEQYSIGDRINFKNKNLAVTEVHGFMDRGIFKYKYKLSMPEGLYQSEIKNKALSGAAIDGKILAVQGETVRMHLSIDNEQVTTKAHWFPFAPPTGNMMYCMPKVGTSARLYFPDTDSGNAEVTGGIRENGGSCAKTGNPNNRYLGTEHGSELAMLPNEMSIKGGSASPLSIKFDGSGVVLTSPKKLTLSASEDVFLKTPKKIIINATNRFLATKGKAVKGISIEGDVNCLGGAAKIEAKDRTSYPNFNDEPKEDKKAKEKAEEEKKKSKLLTIGLCVLAAVAVVAAVAVSVVTFGAGAVVGAALVGAAIGAVTAFATTSGSLEDRLKAAVIGGLVGLVCGAIFGPFSGMAADLLEGGVTNVLTGMADRLMKGEELNPLSMLGDFASGVAFAGLLRFGGKAISKLAGKAVEKLSPFLNKTVGYMKDKFMPAAEKAVKDFGNLVKDTAGDLKNVKLVPSPKLQLAGGFDGYGNDIKLSDVGNNFKNGVNDIKDNFMKATKSGDDIKPKPLENGPYIKNGKPHGRPKLSGEKKLQFETDVYNNNVDPDGVLRDPNTGDVIDWKPGKPRKNVVDFGHKSGNCYNDMFQKYKSGEITLEELKEFQFDPYNYRLETPSANRSHRYE